MLNGSVAASSMSARFPPSRSKVKSEGDSLCLATKDGIEKARKAVVKPNADEILTAALTPFD